MPCAPAKKGGRITGILPYESDEVVMRKLTELGGSGGVIAIDRLGNIAMPFNSEGMYRGYRLADQEPVVGILR